MSDVKFVPWWTDFLAYWIHSRIQSRGPQLRGLQSNTVEGSIVKESTIEEDVGVASLVLLTLSLLVTIYRAKNLANTSIPVCHP